MIERRQYGTVLLLSCPLESAPTRRDAERAAVGRLLHEAFPEGYSLSHTPEGAPLLDRSGTSISISHSRARAAVALCPCGAAIGIDIETLRPQLRRVAPRVLSASELEFYGTTDEQLLRAWTLKEALYKAALTPGLDFRRDIHLPCGHKKNEATVAAPSGAAMRFAILASDVSGGEGLALVQSLVP